MSKCEECKPAIVEMIKSRSKVKNSTLKLVDGRATYDLVEPRPGWYAVARGLAPGRLRRAGPHRVGRDWPSASAHDDRPEAAQPTCRNVRRASLSRWHPGRPDRNRRLAARRGDDLCRSCGPSSRARVTDRASCWVADSFCRAAGLRRQPLSPRRKRRSTYAPLSPVGRATRARAGQLFGYGLVDGQVRFLKGWFLRRRRLPAALTSSGWRCCGSTATRMSPTIQAASSISTTSYHQAALRSSTTTATSRPAARQCTTSAPPGASMTQSNQSTGAASIGGDPKSPAPRRRVRHAIRQRTYFLLLATGVMHLRRAQGVRSAKRVKAIAGLRARPRCISDERSFAAGRAAKPSITRECPEPVDSELLLCRPPIRHPENCLFPSEPPGSPLSSYILAAKGRHTQWTPLRPNASEKSSTCKSNAARELKACR